MPFHTKIHAKNIPLPLFPHAARGELMTARAGLAIIIPSKNLTNPPEYVIITLWSF